MSNHITKKKLITAFCFVAVIAVSAALIILQKPEYVDTSTVFVTGETVNTEPVLIEPRVCRIEVLAVPENPEPAPLYAYYVFPSEKDAERIRDAWDYADPSKGIYVEHGGYEPKSMYKFPFMSGGRIASMVTVRLFSKGTNTHSFTADGDFFNALAALTSPEEPLYIFYDQFTDKFGKIGYMPFYIIGDTAYTEFCSEYHTDEYLYSMTIPEDKEFVIVKFDPAGQD